MRRNGRQIPEFLILLYTIGIVAAVAQPIYSQRLLHATKHGISLSLRVRLVTLGIAITIGIVCLIVISVIIGTLITFGIYLCEKYAKNSKKQRL